MQQVRDAVARWELEESTHREEKARDLGGCPAPVPGQVLHVADARITSIRLRRRIASGGMGEVWAAECLGDGREVAVKFAAKDVDSQGVRKRAIHEANVLHRARHPHVVQLLGMGRSPDGTPFIVMELLRGRTLAAELALGGPLALDAAARAMAHISSALEHIHGLGIVHRDIKPQNLFVCGEGPAAQLKIVDFGLATAVEGSARGCCARAVPRLAGSLAFMTPEDLLATTHPSVHSDLWALAVTAYLTLTRRLPFRGRSNDVWRRCPNAWKFELPSVHRADIPARIDEWFRRAFSRHPADRHPSAAQASAAFCRAIADHDAIVLNRRPCLSDDEILAFSTGSMSPAAVQLADDHCGTCEACSDLLNAIAGFAGEPPFPARHAADGPAL